MMNVGLSESDEKYLDIVEEPIYVTIAGGPSRLESFNKDVILNGSLSYDPNVLKGNPRDLDFIWRCQVMSDTALSEMEERGCFGYGKTIVRDDSTIQRLPADILRGNAVYIVTLSAESKIVHGRKSSFQQIIGFPSGKVIRTSIE